MSLVEDDRARAAMKGLARRVHRQVIADRGMDMEAQVLEVIRDLHEASPHAPLSVKDITQWFVDRHGEEYDRKVTTRWIGSVIRKKLRLEPYKSHGVFPAWRLSPRSTHPTQRRATRACFNERCGAEPSRPGISVRIFRLAP